MGTHLVKEFPSYLGSKSLAETSHGSRCVQGAEREGTKDTEWLGFSEREWLWAEYKEMPGAESLLSQHVTGFGSPGQCEVHPHLRRRL